MIGVAVNPADMDVAREFFELFKIAWEPATCSRRYRVILSTGPIENLNAELFLVYNSREEGVDRETGTGVTHSDGPTEIQYAELELPIFGSVAWFGRKAGSPILQLQGKALDYRERTAAGEVWRFGYDLFEEVRHLLVVGQPAIHAAIPTLELHIAALRQALLTAGVSFVEIPPRPCGYQFTCCLTHDVDFFGIRRHKFDRTLAGFVFRASVGTLADLLRGRRSATEAVRNWAALLLLPLVFLGLMPDFWCPFEDYARAEEGRRSTFFLVPFKEKPGGPSPEGIADPGRAVPYQISEIEQDVRKANTAGSELAVHGIDAWCDGEAGRAEMSQLSSLTTQPRVGVRMHWLYFDVNSPRCLESAGFDYDSTWGYNETVGYRAGTSQVFRLAGSQQLLELPLSIMDSAMFYPGRMGLSPAEAMQLCRGILTNARRFGGTLVINWHDRSLVPDRLWDGRYRDLLQEVGKDNQAWFATAGEAVDWFRWRRSIRFIDEPESGSVEIAASASGAGLPAGLLRIHRPRAVSTEAETDLRFDGTQTVRLQL